MQGAQMRLFGGQTFGPEEVIDCRVQRMKTRGLVTAIALGSLPTSLSITLRDGRMLSARSRGPGEEQDAIDEVLSHITAWQVSRAREAMAGGGRYAFGSVELTAEGIAAKSGGKLTRWDDIAGWAVRYGGLVWDDANGKLAGEVWLGAMPFSDALVAAVAERLPGRDYEKMAPGQGPKHGFFSVTARTRIPGTFKYQLHVVVLGPLVLLGLFGLFVLYNKVRLRLEYARGPLPKPYVTGIDRAGGALALAPNPNVPPCTNELRAYSPMLVSSDKTTASKYANYKWSKCELDDLGYSSEFYVWRLAGPDVRVVLWDADTSTAKCYASAPAKSDPVPEAIAQKLVFGWHPAAPASASASASASAPAAPAVSAPKPAKGGKKKKTR